MTDNSHTDYELMQGPFATYSFLSKSRINVKTEVVLSTYINLISKIS